MCHFLVVKHEYDTLYGWSISSKHSRMCSSADTEAALECVGERRPLISVAIYQTPLVTPLLNLVLRERRIQGTLCYTADDYRAVIDLMASGHYDTTGWVETIPIDNVIEDGYEPLHAGTKMKLLVDPAP
jgi:(R,R)-butanediol dehydrogenase/meso-butanediol dehydrogenase/diacetyl reductase